jgi:hypothetical protein
MHERAAQVHDDAAEVWQEHGDTEKAAYERELAKNDRDAAALDHERRAPETRPPGRTPVGARLPAGSSSDQRAGLGP